MDSKARAMLGETVPTSFGPGLGEWMASPPIKELVREDLPLTLTSKPLPSAPALGGGGGGCFCYFCLQGVYSLLGPALEPTAVPSLRDPAS